MIFFNILNVKEKTNSWPQSFYEINAFLTKIIFLLIFSNFMSINKSDVVCIFCLNNKLNFIDCIYVVRVGANHTFYFQDVSKATPSVDLVIADFLEGLYVPEILNTFVFHTFLEYKIRLSSSYFFFACNIFTTMVFC